MKIIVDLPLLYLDDVTYDNETLRYEKMRMELWHDGLKEISNIISTSKDIFFQTEMVINKELLEQSGLDPDSVAFNLSKFLFKDIKRVEAVRQSFVKTIRYDEIEPDHYDATKTYVVDNLIYEIFTPDELQEFAANMASDRLFEMSVREVIGELEFIDEYFDVIDTKRVAIELRKKLKRDDNVSLLSKKIFENDEELIHWMIDYNEEFTLDTIEIYMDYVKLGKHLTETEDDIIMEMERVGQHLVSMGDVKFPDGTSEYFYIFERY